jgi:inosine triphosphate pyrophosphatase
MDITFITGNANKARYLSDYFRFQIAHHKLDLVEIQSLDPQEIVAHKAAEAFRALGTPVLIEDASLVFHALGSLPGPLIKWFMESLDNEGLCRLLDGYQDRSATASVMYGLHDGSDVRFFSGSAHGRIAGQPSGEKVFGFDPIFVPDGHTLTWAEMSPDEKHETSMRKPALENLAAYLRTR